MCAITGDWIRRKPTAYFASPTQSAGKCRYFSKRAWYGKLSTTYPSDLNSIRITIMYWKQHWNLEPGGGKRLQTAVSPSILLECCCCSCWFVVHIIYVLFARSKEWEREAFDHGPSSACSTFSSCWQRRCYFCGTDPPSPFSPKHTNNFFSHPFFFFFFFFFFLSFRLHCSRSRTQPLERKHKQFSTTKIKVESIVVRLKLKMLLNGCQNAPELLGNCTGLEGNPTLIKFYMVMRSTNPGIRKQV